jgi:hypothetical protein
MKSWYVYRDGVLVDVVQAYTASSACDQAAGRTVFTDSSALNARSTFVPSRKVEK